MLRRNEGHAEDCRFWTVVLLPQFFWKDRGWKLAKEDSSHLGLIIANLQSPISNEMVYLHVCGGIIREREVRGTTKL